MNEDDLEELEAECAPDRTFDRSKEALEFWKAVYLAAIRAGCPTYVAKDKAYTAVNDLSDLNRDV